MVGFGFKPGSEAGTPLSQYGAIETDISSISKFNQAALCLRLQPPHTSISHWARPHTGFQKKPWNIVHCKVKSWDTGQMWMMMMLSKVLLKLHQCWNDFLIESLLDQEKIMQLINPGVANLVPQRASSVQVFDSSFFHSCIPTHPLKGVLISELTLCLKWKAQYSWLSITHGWSRLYQLFITW